MHSAAVITSAFLLYAVFPVLTQASDSPQKLDASLRLEAQGDSTETRSYAVDVNLAISTKDMLSLRAAHSSTPIDTDTITTTQYVVGWTTRALTPYSIDLSYEYWGNNNELKIQTAHAGLFWEGAIWSLGINLDYRTITFTSRPIGMLQRHIDTDDYAYGPELRYFRNSWDWRIYAMQYRYSKDPSRFDTPRAIRLLGSRLTNISSNLNDWRVGTEVHYQFSAVRTGLTYQHVVSAVNQLTAEVYSVVTIFDLPQNLSLELEAGSSTLENNNSIHFALIALGLSF